MIEPKPGAAVGLAILGVFVVTIGNQFEVPFIVALTGGLALVFWAFAGAYALEWLLVVAVEGFTRYQEAAAITPILRAMQAAASLTPEQAMLVPRMEYGAEVGVVATKQDSRLMLITPNGNIPLEFIQRFLLAGGAQYLHTVGAYSDKTPERNWAVGFTEWCIYNGFATAAVGPYPARWMDNTSRATVAGMLGLSLEVE